MNIKKEISCMAREFEQEGKVKKVFKNLSPGEIEEVLKEINKEFAGFQILTKKGYSFVEVCIGRALPRKDTSKLGRIRRRELGLDDTAHTVAAEFEDTYKCPACGRYLPKSEFYLRRINDRTSYCKRCAKLYSKWYKGFLKTHGISSIKPVYGPNIPNEEFKDYVEECQVPYS